MLKFSTILFFSWVFFSNFPSIGIKIVSPLQSLIRNTTNDNFDSVLIDIHQKDYQYDCIHDLLSKKKNELPEDEKEMIFTFFVDRLNRFRSFLSEQSNPREDLFLLFDSYFLSLIDFQNKYYRKEILNVEYLYAWQFEFLIKILNLPSNFFYKNVYYFCLANKRRFLENKIFIHNDNIKAFIEWIIQQIKNKKGNLFSLLDFLRKVDKKNYSILFKNVVRRIFYYIKANDENYKFFYQYVCSMSNKDLEDQFFIDFMNDRIVFYTGAFNQKEYKALEEFFINKKKYYYAIKINKFSGKNACKIKYQEILDENERKANEPNYQKSLQLLTILQKLSLLENPQKRESMLVFQSLQLFFEPYMEEFQTCGICQKKCIGEVTFFDGIDMHCATNDQDRDSIYVSACRDVKNGYYKKIQDKICANNTYVWTRCKNNNNIEQNILVKKDKKNIDHTRCKKEKCPKKQIGRDGGVDPICVMFQQQKERGFFSVLKFIIEYADLTLGSFQDLSLSRFITIDGKDTIVVDLQGFNEMHFDGLLYFDKENQQFRINDNIVKIFEQESSLMKQMSIEKKLIDHLDASSIQEENNIQLRYYAIVTGIEHCPREEDLVKKLQEKVIRMKEKDIFGRPMKDETPLWLISHNNFSVFSFSFLLQSIGGGLFSSFIFRKKMNTMPKKIGLFCVSVTGVCAALIVKNSYWQRLAWIINDKYLSERVDFTEKYQNFKTTIREMKQI